MKSEKLIYVMPSVEILEMEVEKGFAISQTGSPETDVLPDWNDGGSLTSINNLLP